MWLTTPLNRLIELENLFNHESIPFPTKEFIYVKMSSLVINNHFLTEGPSLNIKHFHETVGGRMWSTTQPLKLGKAIKII
jgi:hypothetical protein